MVKKKLKIEGMHCSSCALLIDMDLEDLAGVRYAKTSYTKAEVEVEYDEDKVDSSKILETIKGTGYQAKISN